MNKRIIKSITALALTVALCPTLPTLAVETDWKDIYYDFIKGALRTDGCYDMALADINLDGTPELMFFDMFSYPSIFQIVDNEVQLRYKGSLSYDTWFKNVKTDYITNDLGFCGTSPSRAYYDFDYNEYDYHNHNQVSTFALRKNINTGELMYSALGIYGQGDVFLDLREYSKDTFFTATKKFFILYGEVGGGGGYGPNHYYIDGNFTGYANDEEIEEKEFDNKFKAYIDEWQDTGYTVDCSGWNPNRNKPTDQEIKDFLNSYIPERKALGLDISVTVNGSEIDFDQPPVIVDERTLVPLRAIFEALGATVDWNGNTQTVTSTLNDTTVALTIGSNTMYKNGEAITLDVPAQLIGDRTLVPVRAIAEAYGATVDWEQATYTVKIQK